MPSLKNCNFSTDDDDYLICSTSDMGQNEKSTSSIALISAVSAVLKVSRGCSDVPKCKVEVGV